MLWVTEIKDGKIMDKDIKMEIQALDDGDYSIEIKKGTKRSLQQNRYYWVVLDILAKETGEDRMILHSWFKNMYLTEAVVGEFVGEYQYTKSTTDLQVNEFIDYMEKIILFCAESGIVIPDKPEGAFDKKVKKTKEETSAATDDVMSNLS